MINNTTKNNAVKERTGRRELEKALRESEAKFRSLAELSPHMIFINVKGSVVFVNKKCIDLLGYSAGEFYSPDFRFITLIAPKDRKIIRSNFNKHMQGEEVDPLKYSLVTKSGDRIRVILGTKLIKYEGDTGVLGIVTDIRQSIKVEEFLRESEEKIRTISEQAVDGIFTTDPGGYFISVNASTCRMLGYNKNELVGKHLRGIISADHNGKDSFRLDTLKKGKPTITECIIRGKDNHRLNVIISVVELHDGNLQGVIRDITERKNADIILRNREEKYRTLFETMTQGVIYQSERGEITSINRAATGIFGVSEDEMIGCKIYDRRWRSIAVDGIYYSSKTHPSMLALKTGNQVKNSILGIYNPTEKKRRWVLIDVVPQFKKGEKDPFQLFTTFTDITERKISREKIEKSRKQLRALAAHLQSVREEERTMISREMHDDFGQTLTSLKMDLSLFNQEILNKKYIPDHEQLIDQINSMSMLVDLCILKVKKIISRLRPEVLDNFGLHTAIESAIMEFQERSNISWSFSSNVREIPLNKDNATAIFRIFQEALTNIVRHSRATKADIQILKRKGELEIEISDNGVGISQKRIDKTESFGIMGMKERAWILNGDLEITGKKNKGTKVIVSIPLSDMN